MFDVERHERIRQTERWGSFGRNGDEPLTHRFIKDLSDDHLNNIIGFIEEYANIRLSGHTYNGMTLRNSEIYFETYPIMINEREYRIMKNISVPDYVELKKLKFGK